MSKTEQRNMFTRGLAIIAIVMILAISMPTIALAYDGFQVGATVYVNVNDYLNLRKEPQGEIIGQLPRGETVTILAKKDRDGYYQVKVNSSGKTGYCYGEYLTQTKVEKNRKTQPATTDGPNVGDIYSIHTAVTLRLKREPSISARYYRFFEDGEQLEILDTKVQEGYIKIRALKDGQEGYAYFKYMTKVKSASQASQNPTTTISTTWQEGQIAIANVQNKLILRELPSADARALDYLDPGAKVKIRSNELTGYYVKVEVVDNSKIGYCDTRYLKPEGEEECECQEGDLVTGMSLYVNAEGRLNFRSNPKFGDNVEFQLHPGDEVKLLSPEITEGFVHVSTVKSGKTGYVQLKYLTFTKP